MTFLKYLDEVKARCEEATGTFHESYDARKVEQAARIMWEALDRVSQTNCYAHPSDLQQVRRETAIKALAAVDALVKS